MNDGSSSRGIRLGAVIAIVAVAAFLVWYVAIRDSGTSGTAPTGTAPVEVSQADLAALAGKLGHPIYWAGDQPDTTTLELRQTSSGKVYVRYLTGSTQLGAKKQSFLTVATYPFEGALAAVQALAQKPGATTKDLEGGGLAVQLPNAPTSVYLADPNQNVEVEVYDPNPKKALDIASSGAVTPVG